MQDQNPKIGDRYIRLDQIGQGAVGTVFLCQDPVMDNRVAIKMLSGDASGQEMMRFQQEAKATARLNHPNIIKVLDFGESGGKAYLVMEYLEGESLESILARRDLSVDALLSIFCQVAGGLAMLIIRGYYTGT
ncbi:MAG: protein kinase [Cyanobacteriota/Melainabacteria group bacterium]